MVDLSFVLNLIFVRRNIVTYVTDRKGHDMRYAIDSRKLQKGIGWEHLSSLRRVSRKP